MAKVKKSKEEVTIAIDGSFGVATVVAKRAGVSRETLYKYLRKWPDLEARLRDEREKLVDMAESKIAKLVSNDDFRAIQMVLERMGRDRGWGVQQEVCVTQAVSVRPIIRFGEEPRNEDGADV